MTTSAGTTTSAKTSERTSASGRVRETARTTPRLTPRLTQRTAVSAPRPPAPPGARTAAPSRMAAGIRFAVDRIRAVTASAVPRTSAAVRMGTRAAREAAVTRERSVRTAMERAARPRARQRLVPDGSVDRRRTGARGRSMPVAWPGTTVPSAALPALLPGSVSATLPASPVPRVGRPRPAARADKCAVMAPACAAPRSPVRPKARTAGSLPMALTVCAWIAARVVWQGSRVTPMSVGRACRTVTANGVARMTSAGGPA